MNITAYDVLPESGLILLLVGVAFIFGRSNMPTLLGHSAISSGFGCAVLGTGLMMLGLFINGDEK